MFVVVLSISVRGMSMLHPRGARTQADHLIARLFLPRTRAERRLDEIGGQHGIRGQTAVGEVEPLSLSDRHDLDELAAIALADQSRRRKLLDLRASSLKPRARSMSVGKGVDM
jgi:hypothetical protein